MPSDSQHRNLGAGVATRFHHRGWKTPGSALNPPPKGTKGTLGAAQEQQPQPLLCGVTSLTFLFAPILQHFPKSIPAHTDWALLGPRGLQDSLPLRAGQDPASKPGHFLLRAPSPAQDWHPKGLQGPFVPPRPLFAQPGPCEVQGQGQTRSLWEFICQSTHHAHHCFCSWEGR